METPPNKVVMLPIEDINILNPRVRNQKVFSGIIENITKVGLKRPITVTRITSSTHDKKYDLICGQGRIEAFQACGQTHIPAIIINASQEEALIMSLVENFARRQHRPLDLIKGIELLAAQGYNAKTIALKTGLTEPYIRSIMYLCSCGEERLLAAVEQGKIPISIAVKIVSTPLDEQKALQGAYESNQLRGNKILQAKKLLEQRKRHGKKLRGDKSLPYSSQTSKKQISSREVVNIYQKEVDRKRLLARKANIVSSHLTFITHALRQLMAEDYFSTLLRAEKLDSIPKQVVELVKGPL